MHITAKPTSFSCNLKCDYCFYLEKETFFEPQQSNHMDIQKLELFIRHYIQSSPNDVYFTWQGGEPTLAGLPFFEKVIELQKQYAHGKTIHNAIQTNGILINKKWCEFLKDHQFLVGISIDGPEHLHDIYRVTKSGKGSFAKVLRAIELLKQHDIAFNTLTVINNINVHYPLETYSFLKTLGTKHIQFIELLETDTFTEAAIPVWLVDQKRPSNVCEFSTPPKEFGNFMASIFREWVSHDVGKIYIRQFESFFNCFIGAGHTSCIFQPTCGDNLVIEANGDIYECDHYVYPTYKLENIKNGIKQLHGQQVAKAKELLPDDCKQCDYLSICNGGCPKHRINTGINNKKSYFCQGYKILFKEMVPYMNAMSTLFEYDQPITNIMPLVKKIGFQN
ncbi:putative enzyme [Photobacterium sp. SKA34]|uniref:anaerobic sulfatase maturase n=1 Tax=Photobacterium sp. SKA34 TaxID=121723 RepID=UPI00006B34AC|nr:anaerobic sulfatase maturase [Photobacterium sp. SKA34]EAR53840.1 putative enzyme [Photobacterium sp. SKA34]